MTPDLLWKIGLKEILFEGLPLYKFTIFLRFAFADMFKTVPINVTTTPPARNPSIASPSDINSPSIAEPT